MTTRRTTCLQRTLVRPGDSRVVGKYEQVSELPLIVDWCRFFAPGSKSDIVCTGLLDNPGRFDFPALVDLGRVHTDGDLSVDVVDLLAAVGLRREAEVAVFANRSGDEVTVPVRALMVGGRLVLNISGSRLSASVTTSVRLDLPDWTDPAVPFHPVSMHVVSFAEFISCP